jgi:hypothetical protein
MEAPPYKLRQMGIRPKVKNSASATYAPQNLGEDRYAELVEEIAAQF